MLELFLIAEIIPEIKCFSKRFFYSFDILRVAVSSSDYLKIEKNKDVKQSINRIALIMCFDFNTLLLSAEVL